MKKRILSLTLVLAIIMAFVPNMVYAEIIDSGECGVDGASVTWTLDNEGTLTLRGDGDMVDWGGGTIAPWGDEINVDGWVQKDMSRVRRVEIFDGITNIGGEAFCECNNLTEITIAKTVTSISCC